MNNDLISRSALLEEVRLAKRGIGKRANYDYLVGYVSALSGVEGRIADAPAVDAEPVRHEGDTTFITTDNLDAYTGRIIVGQGNMCKVYYADESTVDAVEVVRCKDCKMLGPYLRSGKYVYCDRTCMIVREEDYCSYGERKMDAEVEG